MKRADPRRQFASTGRADGSHGNIGHASDDDDGWRGCPGRGHLREDCSALLPSIVRQRPYSLRYPGERDGRVAVTEDVESPAPDGVVLAVMRPLIGTTAVGS